MGEKEQFKREKEWEWANIWWIRFDWFDDSLKFDVHKGYSMLQLVQFTWKNHSSNKNSQAKKHLMIVKLLN